MWRRNDAEGVRSIPKLPSKGGSPPFLMEFFAVVRCARISGRPIFAQTSHFSEWSCMFSSFRSGCIPSKSGKGRYNVTSNIKTRPTFPCSIRARLPPSSNGWPVERRQRGITTTSKGILFSLAGGVGCATWLRTLPLSSL